MPGEKKVIRFLLLGASGAGKTQLRQVASGQKFSSAYEHTAGVDFSSIENQEINETQCKFEIWDMEADVIAQVEGYYLRDCDIVFICVDLTERRTITTECWKNFCKEKGYIGFEVSAKTGQNIDYLFIRAAKEFLPKEAVEANTVSNQSGLLAQCCFFLRNCCKKPEVDELQSLLPK